MHPPLMRPSALVLIALVAVSLACGGSGGPAPVAPAVPGAASPPGAPAPAPAAIPKEWPGIFQVPPGGTLVRVSGEPGERSVTWSLPGETPAVFAAIKAQAGADYVLKGELAEMGTILFDSKDGETSIIGAFNGETVSIMEATNQDLTK